MLKFIKIFLLICCLLPRKGLTQKNDLLPVYTGNDLGLQWNNDTPVLKVWAPLADSVRVQLFGNDLSTPIAVQALKQGLAGSWSIELNPS